jgi:hypothetical protein
MRILNGSAFYYSIWYLNASKHPLPLLVLVWVSVLTLIRTYTLGHHFFSMSCIADSEQRFNLMITYLDSLVHHDFVISSP